MNWLILPALHNFHETSFGIQGNSVDLQKGVRLLVVSYVFYQLMKIYCYKNEEMRINTSASYILYI